MVRDTSKPMQTFNGQGLENTVFTLSIETPYLLITLVLKFEKVHTPTCVCAKILLYV